MTNQEFSLVDKLPSAIDLEKTLLGLMLLDYSSFDLAKRLITGYDFALPEHQKLFFNMEYLNKKYGKFNKEMLLDCLRHFLKNHSH